MTDLAVRSLSSAAMIFIALATALLGGYYFAFLVAAAATVVFYEWSRLVRGWGLGWAVAGFFYALIPALCLLWLRDRAEGGLALLLWVFLVTWATDVGAYFVGRAFGRTRFAPSISPNKTVAGLYGGMIAAALVGGAWALVTELGPTALVLAPLFALAAQAGDLFESWMKRRAGVKDSANWLPGHGGLLDRLDGLVPLAVLTVAADLTGLT